MNRLVDIDDFTLGSLLAIAELHASLAAGDESEDGRFSFLESYLSQLDGLLHSDRAGQREALSGELEARAARESPDSPLRRLREEYDFEQGGVTALFMSGLCEYDDAFGQLFQSLQSPLPFRRPTLGMLCRLIPSAASGLEHPVRRLLGEGLLYPVSEDLPSADWPLRPAPLVWRFLRGNECAQPRPWVTSSELGSSPDFAPAFCDEILRAARQAERGELSTLVLRARPGTEPERWARVFASKLGRGIIERPMVASKGGSLPAELGALCRLARVLPVLVGELGPGETMVLRCPEQHRGPLILIGGSAGGYRVEGGGQLTLDVPGLDRRERCRVLSSALPQSSLKWRREVAKLHVLPPAYLKAAATAARVRSNKGRPTYDDFRAGLREVGRENLDNFATRVDQLAGWGQFFAPTETVRELRLLEQRCRSREDLTSALGGPASGTGVRALFSGPSGTGKTLVSKVLAAALHKDLYRVELSAVVSKYIGESSKHLYHVLKAAEASDVALVLDEGDALLGRRTEDATANARYANMDTSFLLQALEEHRGIVFITTNLEDNVDPAYRRRLDIIRFPMPTWEQRSEIWRMHVPGRLRASDVDLTLVAKAHRLSGGQISNAAQHALLLAIDAGRTKLGSADLTRAVRREFAKSGRPMPSSAPRREPGHGVIPFFGALSEIANRRRASGG